MKYRVYNENEEYECSSIKEIKKITGSSTSIIMYQLALANGRINFKGKEYQVEIINEKPGSNIKLNGVK